MSIIVIFALIIQWKWCYVPITYACQCHQPGLWFSLRILEKNSRPLREMANQIPIYPVHLIFFGFWPRDPSQQENCPDNLWYRAANLVSLIRWMFLYIHNENEINFLSNNNNYVQCKKMAECYWKFQRYLKEFLKFV